MGGGRWGWQTARVEEAERRAWSGQRVPTGAWGELGIHISQGRAPELREVE